LWHIDHGQTIVGVLADLELQIRRSRRRWRSSRDDANELGHAARGVEKLLHRDVGYRRRGAIEGFIEKQECHPRRLRRRRVVDRPFPGKGRTVEDDVGQDVVIFARAFRRGKLRLNEIGVEAETRPADSKPKPGGRRLGPWFLWILSPAV